MSAIAERSEGTILTRRAETRNVALFMSSAAIAHKTSTAQPRKNQRPRSEIFHGPRTKVRGHMTSAREPHAQQQLLVMGHNAPGVTVDKGPRYSAHRRGGRPPFGPPSLCGAAYFVSKIKSFGDFFIQGSRTKTPGEGSFHQQASTQKPPKNFRMCISVWVCAILRPMWTPLLLICYIDRLDCAIPVAPAYLSEQECLVALEYVIDAYRLPDGMEIMAYDCYNWGQGS
jgi:hypothetical protein